MKQLLKKLIQFIFKISVPLCGIAAAICVFVANNSPNLCIFPWGYELDMPQQLKNKFNL